ncbi:Protein of unknown function [Gryllus bimaculatus]|nr:Protein of unknown function [Gryllus bimaculatus]
MEATLVHGSNTTEAADALRLRGAAAAAESCSGRRGRRQQQQVPHINYCARSAAIGTAAAATSSFCSVCERSSDHSKTPLFLLFPGPETL